MQPTDPNPRPRNRRPRIGVLADPQRPSADSAARSALSIELRKAMAGPPRKKQGTLGNRRLVIPGRRPKRDDVPQIRYANVRTPDAPGTQTSRGPR